MSDALPVAFDYDSLDPGTREFVRRAADETHGLMRRAVGDIVGIGENLLAVKERLPDMKYSAWLRAEFALSRQSAYRYMRVAEKFGKSCHTVLQLPARVLYELAAPSTPQSVVEMVQAGQVPPTLEAIREAKGAELRALAEKEAAEHQLVQERSNARAQLELLSGEVEELNRRIAALQAVQVKEVPVVPPEVAAQLESLRQQVRTVTLQRDALVGQVAELGEQARAAALKRDEGEYERRVRLNWYSITADLRAGVLKALSRWPCALDAQVFEADDWARLSQARTLARRLLEACDALTPGSGTLIVESVPGPFSGDKKNGAGVDWKE